MLSARATAKEAQGKKEAQRKRRNARGARQDTERTTRNAHSGQRTTPGAQWGPDPPRIHRLRPDGLSKSPWPEQKSMI